MPVIVQPEAPMTNTEKLTISLLTAKHSSEPFTPRTFENQLHLITPAECIAAGARLVMRCALRAARCAARCDR